MKVIIFLILCCGSLISHSQDRDELIKDANAYAMAAEKRDWSTVVMYTHLSVVNLFGGREKMTELLKLAMEEMSSKGKALHSVTIGEPGKFFKVSEEIQSIIPQTAISKVPGGKEVLNSYLLAVSLDKGNSWTFINLTGMSRERVQKLLPTISTELQLPESNEPIFQKD